MRTWLKNCVGMRSKHLAGLLMVVIAISCASVLMFQDKFLHQIIAATMEPECCLICGEGNGRRYHAPALMNLSTGTIWELKIYDNDPKMPWEVAEEQSWNDWAFTLLDENAVMTWSAENHTNIATIGNDADGFNPAYFCYECRERLDATVINGYALLDLYDLRNIRMFDLEDGVTHVIRDYTVTIYKDEGKNCLIVETVGHLFDVK